MNFVRQRRANAGSGAGMVGCLSEGRREDSKRSDRSSQHFLNTVSEDRGAPKSTPSSVRSTHQAQVEFCPLNSTGTTSLQSAAHHVATINNSPRPSSNPQECPRQIHSLQSHNLERPRTTRRRTSSLGLTAGPGPRPCPQREARCGLGDELGAGPAGREEGVWAGRR